LITTAGLRVTTIPACRISPKRRSIILEVRGVAITQTDSVSSEIALSIGVTLGGWGWEGGGTNALPIYFILQNSFFSGYWLEVEIHTVNLACPHPNIINKITPMVVSIKTVI
jgi:hypothetical protein